MSLRALENVKDCYKSAEASRCCFTIPISFGTGSSLQMLHVARVLFHCSQGLPLARVEQRQRYCLHSACLRLICWPLPSRVNEALDKHAILDSPIGQHSAVLIE